MKKLCKNLLNRVYACIEPTTKENNFFSLVFPNFADFCTNSERVGKLVEVTPNSLLGCFVYFHFPRVFVSDFVIVRAEWMAISSLRRLRPELGARDEHATYRRSGPFRRCCKITTRKQQRYPCLKALCPAIRNIYQSQYLSLLHLMSNPVFL